MRLIIFWVISRKLNGLYIIICGKSGFIVLFKEDNSALRCTKKGNVDTDIVFEIRVILLIIKIR